MKVHKTKSIYYHNYSIKEKGYSPLNLIVQSRYQEKLPLLKWLTEVAQLSSLEVFKRHLDRYLIRIVKETIPMLMWGCTK